MIILMKQIHIDMLLYLQIQVFELNMLRNFLQIFQYQINIYDLTSTISLPKFSLSNNFMKFIGIESKDLFISSLYGVSLLYIILLLPYTESWLKIGLGDLHHLTFNIKHFFYGQASSHSTLVNVSVCLVHFLFVFRNDGLVLF